MHYLTSMLLDFSLMLDVEVPQMNRNRAAEFLRGARLSGPQGKGPPISLHAVKLVDRRWLFLYISDITHLQ